MTVADLVGVALIMQTLAANILSLAQFPGDVPGFIDYATKDRGWYENCNIFANPEISEVIML